MAEYIDKVAATTIPTPPKENRVYQTYNLDDVFDAGWHEAQRCISNLPAASVRENVPIRTRGDRIRAMSDEELAEWIYQETTNAFNLLLLGNSKPTKSFFTWLDWLKQEVE